jgi:ketosteroid isomerase-like protein
MACDDANLEIVRNLYACFERGDLAGLMALLHDDVDWVWNGPAVIPYAGARRGRSGVGAFLRSVSDSLTIEEFARRRFLAEAAVWTVRAGKIASFRCFADTAAIVAAFRS